MKTETIYHIEGMFDGTICHFEDCFGGLAQLRLGGKADAELIEDFAKEQNCAFSQKEVTAEYVIAHPDEFPVEYLKAQIPHSYPNIGEELVSLLK